MTGQHLKKKTDYLSSKSSIDYRVCKRNYELYLYLIVYVCECLPWWEWNPVL